MDLKQLVTKELDRQESDPVGGFDRIVKSSERSVGLRNLGNDMFRNVNHNAHRHELILKYYSASLAMAPNDSAELAFAYGNKSALLLHLSKYEDCLKDVDRGLKISVATRVLRVKLLCRKIECLAAVGRVEGRKEALEEARRLLDYLVDRGEKDKEALVKIVEKATALVESGNARVSSKDETSTEHLRLRARTESQGIFHNVGLSRDAKHGRHLAATKDIVPGELIFVAEPYAAVANLKDCHKYCGHCANFLWSSVACDNCSINLYCSEKCRDEARVAYHDVECPILQLFVTGVGMEDYQVHLALRCVIKAVKEFGSVGDVVDVVKQIDSQPDDRKGFLDDGRFDNRSFRSLFKIRNSRGVSPGFLKHLTERACRVAIVLAKCTNLFGENREIRHFAKNENVVFIATLLLRISKIVLLEGDRYREGTSFCKNGKDQVTCSISLSCCERGMFIDTTSGLFPHSCNPNVRSVQIEEGKVLWYALQPISKSQPLLTTYKSCFFELDKSARSRILFPHINRICDCIACANDWPTVLIRNGYPIDTAELPLILLEAMKNLNICQNFSIWIGEDEQYSQSTVKDLTKLMSAMFEKTTQPSQPLCALISILRFVFDRLHGIKLRMPNECRKVLS